MAFCVRYSYMLNSNCMPIQNYKQTTAFQPHKDNHSLVMNKYRSFQNWLSIGKITEGSPKTILTMTVSATVTSHTRQRPLLHGMKVKPSGHFPSALANPSGSLTARIFERPRDRHSKSFSCWWRVIPPILGGRTSNVPPTHQLKLHRGMGGARRWLAQTKANIHENYLVLQSKASGSDWQCLQPTSGMRGTCGHECGLVPIGYVRSANNCDLAAAILIWSQTLCDATAKPVGRRGEMSPKLSRLQTVWSIGMNV